MNLLSRFTWKTYSRQILKILLEYPPQFSPHEKIIQQGADPTRAGQIRPGKKDWGRASRVIIFLKINPLQNHDQFVLIPQYFF